LTHRPPLIGGNGIGKRRYENLIMQNDLLKKSWNMEKRRRGLNLFFVFEPFFGKKRKNTYFLFFFRKREGNANRRSFAYPYLFFKFLFPTPFSILRNMQPVLYRQTLPFQCLYTIIICFEILDQRVSHAVEPQENIQHFFFVDVFHFVFFVVVCIKVTINSSLL
jgi:hypothetical protein